ncbi:MAG TPA: hypothetical protein VFW65_35200 [Pseudonocardiaceae bacterium]|nr:hypothetical protein [Pseudonocardiaceae bacterium]
MYVIDAAPDQPDPNRPDPTPGQPSGPGDNRAHRVADRIHRDALAAIQAAHRDTEGQLARADSKATVLLGLVGAALAGALALAHATAGPAGVVMAAAVVALTASVMVLLLVLRARPGREHGIARWALFAAHPAALVEELTLPARHAVTRDAGRLTELAALAMTKHRAINAALALLLLGLALLTLAALIT